MSHKITMKFYESHFQEYIASSEKHNIHPYLSIYPYVPLADLPVLVFYGPSGVGKYTQALRFINYYSPSHLKYEKKMELSNQTYIYKISDIHYEIDLSILGCNSKTLWHEFIAQVVEIIAMKPQSTEKIGIILCKGFHSIHTELLDIFYSYIQQYRNQTTSQVFLRFILLTENVSFLPNNILHCSHIVSFKRPSYESFTDSPLLSQIPNCDILNIKELQSFSLVSDVGELPVDSFNVICDKIIEDIRNPEVIEILSFRDKIYDILVYNLDVAECIWYIFSQTIENLSEEDIRAIRLKMYSFLKYFNNNYRPIYHLESILFTIINARLRNTRIR